MIINKTFNDLYTDQSGIKVRNVNNDSITITNQHNLSLGIDFAEAKDLYDILGAIIAKENK